MNAHYGWAKALALQDALCSKQIVDIESWPRAIARKFAFNGSKSSESIKTSSTIPDFPMRQKLPSVPVPLTQCSNYIMRATFHLMTECNGQFHLAPLGVDCVCHLVPRSPSITRPDMHASSVVDADFLCASRRRRTLQSLSTERHTRLWREWHYCVDLISSQGEFLHEFSCLEEKGALIRLYALASSQLW